MNQLFATILPSKSTINVLTDDLKLRLAMMNDATRILRKLGVIYVCDTSNNTIRVMIKPDIQFIVIRDFLKRGYQKTVKRKTRDMAYETVGMEFGCIKIVFEQVTDQMITVN